MILYKPMLNGTMQHAVCDGVIGINHKHIRVLFCLSDSFAVYSLQMSVSNSKNSLNVLNTI